MTISLNDEKCDPTFRKHNSSSALHSLSVCDKKKMGRNNSGSAGVKTAGILMPF